MEKQTPGNSYSLIANSSNNNYYYVDYQNNFGLGNFYYPYEPYNWPVNKPWSSPDPSPYVAPQPFFPDIFKRMPLNGIPELYITVNKSRTKIHTIPGHNVNKMYVASGIYMDNNTEFEFELFNPTTETLGVKFKINGDYISDNCLVLYPGKRIFLDRYLNTPNKFKFTTYTVEADNEQVQKAIANNGLIEVEFFREKLATNYMPVFNDNSNFDWLKENSLQPDNNIFYCNSNQDFNINDYIMTTATSNTFKEEFKSVPKKEMETGRVAQGSKSDTTLKNVLIDFELNTITKYTYQILPTSQKPIEPKDLIRKCTNCSKKVKKEDKYCRNCGQKI